METVAERLSSTLQGLDVSEAARRLAEIGPNPIRTHHARALEVLARQPRSPLLLLLLLTALVSAFLGERNDAAIVGAIAMCGARVVNEYGPERAVEVLREQIRRDAPRFVTGTGPTPTSPTWSRRQCVVEGRRVFSKTIKHALMGTSSNFGNMFSVAEASAFLPFLPMLPRRSC